MRQQNPAARAFDMSTTNLSRAAVPTPSVMPQRLLPLAPTKSTPRSWLAFVFGGAPRSTPQNAETKSSNMHTHSRRQCCPARRKSMPEDVRASARRWWTNPHDVGSEKQTSSANALLAIIL